MTVFAVMKEKWPGRWCFFPNPGSSVREQYILSDSRRPRARKGRTSVSVLSGRRVGHGIATDSVTTVAVIDHFTKRGTLTGKHIRQRPGSSVA